MKAKSKDYRLAAKPVEGLSCEALHWSLIENIWDDYWAAFARKNNSPQNVELFLSELTAGQRAAVAVRILDNKVRLHGWGDVVSNMVFHHEVFLAEVRLAYELLNAGQFLALLKRVLIEYKSRLSEIDPIETEFKTISAKRKQFNVDANDTRFAEDSKRFWDLHDQKAKLMESLMCDRQTWREQFLALADSPETKIESLVERYVKTNAADFFVAQAS